MQAREMTDLEQRMTQDFTWAESAPEIQENPEHFGKLVVVHNRQVLAVGRDRQALIEEASQAARVPGSQLVVVLVPRPGLWEVPH